MNYSLLGRFEYYWIASIEGLSIYFTRRSTTRYFWAFSKSVSLIRLILGVLFRQRAQKHCAAYVTLGNRKSNHRTRAPRLRAHSILHIEFLIPDVPVKHNVNMDEETWRFQLERWVHWLMITYKLIKWFPLRFPRPLIKHAFF